MAKFLSSKQMGPKLLLAISSLPSLELGKPPGKVCHIPFAPMEFDWGILSAGGGTREFHFFQSDLNKKTRKTKVKERLGDLVSLGRGYGPPLSTQPDFRGTYVDLDIACEPKAVDLWNLKVGFVTDEGERIELPVSKRDHEGSSAICPSEWREAVFDPATRRILRDYLSRLQGVAQYIWDEASRK